MNKHPFIPDAWVKCIHENKICMGRTYQINDVSGKAKQMVSLIYENGSNRRIAYQKLQKIAILKFLTIQDFENENSISRSMPKYKLTETLAIRQTKVVMS